MAGKPADDKRPADTSSEQVSDTPGEETAAPSTRRDRTSDRKSARAKEPEKDTEVEPGEAPAPAAPEASDGAAAEQPRTPDSDVAPAPPAPPKVVASSSRRVARRPAVPPSSAGAALDTVTDLRASVDGAGQEEADGTPVAVAAHVPVKKKGSRKR